MLLRGDILKLPGLVLTPKPLYKSQVHRVAFETFTNGTLGFIFPFYSQFLTCPLSSHKNSVVTIKSFSSDRERKAGCRRIYKFMYSVQVTEGLAPAHLLF